MKKRFKISKGKSRKLFKKGARRVHVKNTLNTRPMRGGIRL